MTKKQVNRGARISVLLSTLLMFFCLFLMTGINFIVFPQHHTKAATNIAGKLQDDPSAPVEEKSSETKNLTIVEEFLHERDHARSFVGQDRLSQHGLFDPGKLPVIHFELISPPPDHCG